MLGRARKLNQEVTKNKGEEKEVRWSNTWDRQCSAWEQDRDCSVEEN